MRIYPTPLHASQIDKLYRLIRQNKLIVVPTDTVYGIGANPWNKAAVDELLTVKERGRDNPSPVLVAGMKQAKELTDGLDTASKALMEAFWPGALTIILKARRSLAMDLGQTNGTVAVRMPDQADLLALLEQVGPLAVTSANLHHQPPSNTVEEAKAYFGEKVAAYMDGGHCGGGAPSTIVRPVFDEGDEPVSLEVLRWGEIQSQALAEVTGLPVCDRVKSSSNS